MSDLPQNKLSAIVRLSIYAQSFKDDMDEIRNVPSVYRANVKPLCRQLLHILDKTCKQHIENLCQGEQNSKTVAQAWHSLNHIMTTVANMSLYEMIQFSQHIKDYEQEINNQVVEGFGRDEKTSESEHRSSVPVS